MRKQSKQRLLTMLSCILVLSLLMTVSSYASQTYTNGYFRYTVQDNSVTITEYFGTDAVVQVPNMIAGDPVNVIGGGAFAGNVNVKTVYLPDTIMNVAEGAFSGGQAVVYANEAQETADDDASGTDDAGRTATETQQKPIGIQMSDGSLYAVDNEGNLVYVDPQGNETVLDDGQNYAVSVDAEGNTQIEDEAGNSVDVSAFGISSDEIEYDEAAEGKQDEQTEPGNTANDGNKYFEKLLERILRWILRVIEQNILS